MPRPERLVLLVLIPLVAGGAQVDRVSVEKVGSRYVLEGEAHIDASPGAIYRAITDYDALEKLDKGIVESRLLERIGDNVALVYTRLTGCVLFFCRNVDRIERVEEISEHEIVAVVVPGDGSDISYEHSRWALIPGETGTRIVYQSEIEPDFWIPAVIGPAILRGVLRRRVAQTLGNLEQAARAYE